jgi:hypothetical protein
MVETATTMIWKTEWRMADQVRVAVMMVTTVMDDSMASI